MPPRHFLGFGFLLVHGSFLLGLLGFALHFFAGVGGGFAHGGLL
jgi:hypothetical protein